MPTSRAAAAAPRHGQEAAWAARGGEGVRAPLKMDGSALEDLQSRLSVRRIDPLVAGDAASGPPPRLGGGSSGLAGAPPGGGRTRP